MPDSYTDAEEEVIMEPSDDLKETSIANTITPQGTPKSARSSPFAEAEGKPVSGIPLSYVNTLEEKKGHRRRQSVPFINQPQPQEEEEEEGEGEVMDIE